MRRPRTELSEFDATEIAAKFTGEKGQVKQLADEYGVCGTTIHRVLNGEYFEVLARREMRTFGTRKTGTGQ